MKHKSWIYRAGLFVGSVIVSTGVELETQVQNIYTLVYSLRQFHTTVDITSQ